MESRSWTSTGGFIRRALIGYRRHCEAGFGFVTAKSADRAPADVKLPQWAPLASRSGRTTYVPRRDRPGELAQSTMRSPSATCVLHCP